jgi:2-oxoglutarate dehydrogenase E2 component (dihydrolipoamide succinyltransferase)
MSVELKVPEVGESVSEAQVGKWFKAEGDSVQKDEPLVELETDKVTVELPSPVSGTMGSIHKRQGEMAKVGEVIAEIREADESASSHRQQREDKGPEKSQSAKRHVGGQQSENTDGPKQTRGQDKGQEPREQDGKQEQPSRPRGKQSAEPEPVDVRPRVMPAAQRALDEHGLSVSEVPASGPGGRLLKEDVLRHVARREAGQEDRPDVFADEPPTASPPSVPAEDYDRDEEVVSMSPIRRRIAQRLVEAQQTAALLTTFNECDMSVVMALREQYQESFQKRYGIKLGFMSFFVKAAVDALKLFPAVNAMVRESSIVYRNYYDVGIAVSTERGLVVPMIRGADHLSFSEIEQVIADFGTRARANKLKLEELEGGTFTITNGGIFGSLLSTPIVNPPQSGVLGMHAIQKRPVAVDDQVVIRPMMYLALTYDHRIVDGREAVSFLKRIKDAIEEPARLLIEI